MKKITLLFLMISLTTLLEAQITYTAADFTFNPNGDTTYYQDLDLSQTTVPQFGEDVFWDYSNVPLVGNTRVTIYEAATLSGFATANIRRAATVEYVGIDFPNYEYFTYDATGFYLDGETDLPLSLPLSGITGNPADTLKVIGGPRVKTEQRPFVFFPATYGDNKTTIGYETINFVADIPSFNLSNLAIAQVAKREHYLEVKGWGNVALLNPQTQAVDTFEAILFHETSMRRDSFFDAANNLIPAALLTPLGLAQGQSGSTEHYSIMVPGVNFLGVYVQTINGTVETARYNEEIFTQGIPVSTKAVKANKTAHAVYPNPIQNDQFQLEIEKNNAENWQLDIYNVLGQSIHNELIINNVSTVELNNNLPSGQYFYIVKNENGQTVANGKLVK